MTNIKKINGMKGTVEKIKARKIKFEIEPLDIGIAQIQYNLTKRLEREIPLHGDFAPIVEKLDSPDKSMNISTLRVVCRNSENKTPKQKLRVLEVEVTDRAGQPYVYSIKEGEKQDILKTIDDKSFFETCKSVAISVSAGIV